MINLTEALRQEIDKEYLLAAASYESIISTPNAPIQAFINLSFIYWEFAAEFTFRDQYEIPDSWGDIGSSKYPAIVNLGLKHYPASSELKFWAKYYPYRHYFENFSEAECLAIVSDPNNDKSMVPYFFLSLFEESMYKSQLEKLSNECSNLPTAKNGYILSFL